MEEQSQEAQPSSEDKGSNKMMLMGIGLVGVVVIAAGAFFLMRGKSSTESATDTAMEEDMMVKDEMMEEDSSMPASDSTGDEMMVEDDDAMMEEDVREITVNGFSFGYTPSSLTMKAGEKIRLTFISDDMVHDFIVEGTDIATDQIKGGDQTVIEFTAPEEPGEYTFYCSVGNHRAQGMEGTLTVE